jgi:hypothetical protein
MVLLFLGISFVTKKKKDYRFLDSRYIDVRSAIYIQLAQLAHAHRAGIIRNPQIPLLFSFGVSLGRSFFLPPPPPPAECDYTSVRQMQTCLSRGRRWIVERRRRKLAARLPDVKTLSTRL